jgi:hypothetical protein
VFAISEQRLSFVRCASHTTGLSALAAEKQPLVLGFTYANGRTRFFITISLPTG